jgi:CheY-like chemotaxis protein
MLRSSESAKQRETLLATMETCVDRGSHLVRQLLYFGRGIEGQRGPLRLRDTVHEIAEIVSATFPRTITIETDVAKDVWPVRADGTQIHQVLLNLCVNARDAMPQGGRLTIVVANETPESALGALRPSMAGSRVRIVVSDTGTGIPAEHLARIWDPFFSTKDPGKGTGLGLSTVLGIVQAHGGTIDVQSESGRGTQFRIHLPAEPVSPTTAKRTATSGPPSGNGETILLVEDEAAIRELTQIILQLHGYNVISAENGADGIAKFHQHANQVRLVLTDFDMPELNGLSFIKKLQQFAPEMKIIMASGIRSGLDSDGCLAELSALGVTTLLTKPCSPETILHAVHDMLHAPGSKCNSSAG